LNQVPSSPSPSSVSPPPSSPKPKSKKPKVEKPKAIPFHELVQNKQVKFNLKMSQLETIHHLKLQNLIEKAEMLGRLKFEEKRVKKELQREKTRISIQLKEEKEFEKFEQQLFIQQSKCDLEEQKIQTKQQIEEIQLSLK
jgi:hypothetical protein